MKKAAQVNRNLCRANTPAAAASPRRPCNLPSVDAVACAIFHRRFLLPVKLAKETAAAAAGVLTLDRGQVGVVLPPFVAVRNTIGRFGNCAACEF